jgi:hypothetical protein
VIQNRAALRRLLAAIDVQEAVRRRAVQQAITEAIASYWLRRSAQFEAVGNDRCDEVALACRSHARLLSGEFGALDEPWPGLVADLDAVLAERVVA